MQLCRCLITCLSIILMVSAKVSQGSSCQNRLDLVIAVDTTSSTSSSEFDHVKAEVKGIVSGFTIGPDNIRLALISMAKRATVELNFNGVNSLSDFNSAVDRLTFSTDTVDLVEGIKVAKESVLSTARTLLTSKILILVKDRRPLSSLVAGASELARVTSETAAVKALGAVVNAVGVGGLWNSMELTALFGKDYLLLKSKNSALESVKSLNKARCISPCSSTGTSSQRFGDCFGSHKLSVSTAVDLAVNSAGNGVCRRTIRKDILPCSGKSDRCFKFDQKSQACGSAGQQLKVSLVRHFVPALERCVATKLVTTDSCGSDHSQNCLDREVELVFLVDVSGPFASNDIKGLVDLLIDVATMLTKRTKTERSLPTRVVAFNSRGIRYWDMYIHHIYKKEIVVIDLKKALGEVDGRPITNAALDKAVQLFKEHGRKNSYRQVILLSHLPSADPEKTQRSAMLAKSAGISIVAFGVGGKVSE